MGGRVEGGERSVNVIILEQAVVPNSGKRNSVIGENYNDKLFLN